MLLTKKQVRVNRCVGKNDIYNLSTDIVGRIDFFPQGCVERPFERL